MELDIVAIVLDEIALEGLEGITLSSLWVRLSDIKFPLNPTEDNVKEFIWSRIIIPKSKYKEIQLYTIPQARPTVQLYNRYDFVNPDTGACVETENVPEDVYGIVTPINDGKVRGSCNSFETRIEVTQTILDKNWSLTEAHNKYKDKLVIVASQRLREYSLRIPCFDPCLPLTPMQYCVLEKIGRSRRYGEVTVGKEASKYRESPKTLFYYRKILLRRGLIKKQQHMISMRQSGQNRIGLVLTLPRFHFIRLMPLAIAAYKINDYLLNEPEYTCDFYELQEKVGVKKKLYKAMFSNYTKNFSVHEYNEDTDNGKKIIRRKVKLVKTLEPEGESDDDNDGDEDGEDGDNGDNEIGGYSLKKIRNFAMFAKSFDPKRIRTDRQLTTQTLDAIDNCANPDGISLRELGEKLRLPKLEIRQLSRVLERNGEVTTMMTDHGKQKIKKFQSVHRIEQRPKIIGDHEGIILELGPNETATFHRRAKIILDAVKKNKIYDELVTFKKLISSDEKDSPYTIDRKSIKTIINKLALNGYVRYIKTLLTCQDKEHKLEIVCDPSITANSPLVRDRIETNKFRFFGSTGEDSYVNRVRKKTRGSLVRNDVHDPLDYDLKYKPSIAKRYGYEPKMKKLMTLYKFLFHVMCVKKQSSYKDWREYIPELIIGSHGWCTLGDIIPRIPLSIFVKIVFINYVIPELEDYLDDPDRRYLTLSKLPADFRKKLMHKRKYIFNIFEELVSLTHMGLVKLEYTDSYPKETAKISIITQASFIDGETVKIYDFHNLSDVERYNSDLSFHCSRGDCSNCSIDPRLFAHNQRNWTYSPSIRNQLNTGETMSHSSRLKTNISTMSFDNSARMEALRRKYPRRKRPISAVAEGSSSLIPNDGGEKEKEKEKEKEGGKGGDNRFETNSTGITPAKKLKKQIKFQQCPSRTTTLIERIDESTSRKPKRIRNLLYDETDVKAIELMKKRRVQWSKEEDSFLLMCRIASILLDPSCPTFVCVPGSLVRDELHKYLPETSMDKTIRACQRRLNYMLKKARTRENVLEWVNDVKQEIDGLNIGRPSTPKSDTKSWSEAFLKYLHILLTKFQAYHLSLSSASTPNLTITYDSLDQLKSNHKIVESSSFIESHKPDLYKEPENDVDLCLFVIQNVITSTLMHNINMINHSTAANNYTHTLFKIYSGYPDVLIRTVLVRLSKNRIMTRVRNLANSTNATKAFKTRGLSPYKISQAYLFKLRTKLGMNTLVTSISDNRITLTDNGFRANVPLVSHLFAANLSNFEITIPDNFVFIDKGKLENRNRNDLTISPPSSQSSSSQSTASTSTVTPSALTNANECSRALIEDPRMASRFALYCFREKLFDDTFTSKQHCQDYLAIKSCPVVCTSKEIKLNMEPFMELLKNSEIKMTESKSTIMDVIPDGYNSLVGFIESHRELGATEEDIMKFCDYIWPEEAIKFLISNKVIHIVGIMAYRYVHNEHVHLWLVHSFTPNSNRLTERGKSILFVPKLWKDAYGNVNKQILFHYLSFILGTLLMKPGISRDKLFTECCDILPPVQVLDIIELLKSVECIEEVVISEPISMTLFDDADEKSEIGMELMTIDKRRDLKSVSFYKATAISFINLCKVKAFLKV